jgi:hypothetical protein
LIGACRSCWTPARGPTDVPARADIEAGVNSIVGGAADLMKHLIGTSLFAPEAVAG